MDAVKTIKERKSQVLQVKVQPPVDQALRNYCKEHGLFINSVVNVAVLEWLERQSQREESGVQTAS